MTDREEILVTGANGFIGSRLVAALAERGLPVRALVRRESPPPPPGFGKPGQGPLDHPQVKLVRGDVTHAESLTELIEGCAQVYHLAGCAKNWAPSRQRYYDVNVQGMLNLFQAARTVGVKRIVWTSTQLTLGPARPGEIVAEDSPRATDHCFTDYEETKCLAETMAMRAAREEGLPVVIVNPTRVFGPGQLTEGNSVSLLIDQYDRGLVPFLPNMGRNMGNWVFVDDVVRGLMLAMERGRVGQRYLLGGDNATLKEFFRTVDRVSGRRHFQLPVFRPGAMLFAYLQLNLAHWFGIYPKITPGWVRTFFADWPCRCDKAAEELGYTWTPLEEAVRITYEWLQRVRNQKP